MNVQNAFSASTGESVVIKGHTVYVYCMTKKKKTESLSSSPQMPSVGPATSSHPNGISQTKRKKKLKTPITHGTSKMAAIKGSANPMIQLYFSGYDCQTEANKAAHKSFWYESLATFKLYAMNSLYSKCIYFYREYHTMQFIYYTANFQKKGNAQQDQ